MHFIIDFILKSNEKKKDSYHPKTVRDRKRKMENRKKLIQIKVDMRKCSECYREVTEKETQGFDFDHLDIYPKILPISKMVASNLSWNDTILPEIEKCRLLCPNCHSKHTKVQKMIRKEEKFEFPKKTRLR